MDKIITIVDDDANILTSLSILLKNEGYQVFSYNDGTQALEELDRIQTDLFILDIKMPGIDGMELLTLIRKVNSKPIIFLTSKADEIDEVIGLKIGADDYIKKPFSQPFFTDL